VSGVSRNFKKLSAGGPDPGMLVEQTASQGETNRGQNRTKSPRISLKTHALLTISNPFSPAF
jgi:hypothetical protein